MAILELAAWRNGRCNTLEDGDHLGVHTIIIADQRLYARRIGTRNEIVGQVIPQGKYSIVLKHHDGLQRRFAREFSVCLAVDDLGANTVVRILPLRIEHAELESRPQQDGQLAINFLLSNKSLLYGIKQSVVLRTAVQPYARLDSHGSCLSLCSDDLMSRVQVTHRTAVAYYVSFETPLIDRKSTRLNSSHVKISYAVFCLKKKNIN